MRGHRFSLALVGLLLLTSLLADPHETARAQSIVATISMPMEQPDTVTVDPVTNRVYVGAEAGVAVLDGTSNAVVNRISMYAAQIAVNPATGRLYVSGQSTFSTPGNLSVIDTNTDSVLTTIRGLPCGASALAVNPVTNRVYVDSAACSEISVLNGASNEVIATVVGDGHLAVNPTTNRLYTGVGSDRVQVVDGATNSVLTTIPANAPFVGAVNPTTNKVYVLDADNNALVVIDGASNSVAATIPLDVAPEAVAVNPTTDHVFVIASAAGPSTTGPGTLSVIDGETNAILETVGVGATPASVAVNPATNRVYVADQGSNSVTVFDDQPAPASSAAPHDARYFPETGFRVDNDTIWNYVVHRGGVANFGYPVSRTFLFRGHLVQFFQRRIVELDENGHPRLLNLLDAGLMPYNSFNGAQLPAFDPALVSTAPSATDAAANLAFIRAHAPDTFEGMPVHFDQTFVNTITPAMAFPHGGDPNLLPGFDLELWGIPTSQPTFDPLNHNFVYLRFQRGIMMYDATCACTQGILLADYLKSVLTGRNLPADLAREAQGSAYYQQYDPGQPDWVHDPTLLPNTDLTNAFAAE